MTQITERNKIKTILDAIRKSPEEIRRQKEADVKEAKIKEFEAENERIRIINLRWKLANVPGSYHASRLTPFTSNPVTKQDKINALNQIKVIEKIKEINDFCKNNIVFYGGYGKGKTYFASNLVRRVLMKNSTAGFIRAREYCDFKNKKSEKVDFFESIKFLVLDEVGDFDMPSWEKMWLKELVIARDAKGFKTLVTTNLSQEKLKEFFKGRAEDRLLNNATVYVDFDIVPGACSLRGVA
jgi:DNA replication protein DnaC